jgi:hypothetical protein
MHDGTRTHGILTNELRETGRGFLQSVIGLPVEAWQFKPAPDRWSIAETAEHVAIVEASVMRLLTTKLASHPLPDEARATQKAKDAHVTTMMFDRSTRRPAPEAVVPAGRFATADEAAGAFNASRSEIINWLDTTELDLRALGAPHPVLGLLDGKQWVLFAAAHCERHTRQILEVKQLPGYPGT